VRQCTLSNYRNTAKTVLHKYNTQYDSLSSFFNTSSACIRLPSLLLFASAPLETAVSRRTGLSTPADGCYRPGEEQSSSRPWAKSRDPVLVHYSGGTRVTMWLSTAAATTTGLVEVAAAVVVSTTTGSSLSDRRRRRRRLISKRRRRRWCQL